MKSDWKFFDSLLHAILLLTHIIIVGGILFLLHTSSRALGLLIFPIMFIVPTVVSFIAQVILNRFISPMKSY